MGTIIDIVSSTLIAGMVLLSVMKMNVELSSAGSDTNVQVITQENTTTVADEIAYDFYKIGYKASPAIIFADTAAITFRSDLHADGVVDTVRYWLGSPLSVSGLNPDLRPLYRVKNGDPVRGSSLGVTSFSLSYYDSTGLAISIPSGGTSSQSILSKVRSIHVAILFQSPTKIGSDYAATYWEEYISPKNLRTLM